MIIRITDYRRENELTTTSDTFLEDVSSCEWLKEQYYSCKVEYFENEEQLNGQASRSAMLKKVGECERFLPCVTVNRRTTQAEYFVSHPAESFKCDLRSFVIRYIEVDLEGDAAIREYISRRRKEIHDLIAEGNFRHKSDECDSAWDGEFDYLTNEEIKAGKL